MILTEKSNLFKAEVRNFVEALQRRLARRHATSEGPLSAAELSRVIAEDVQEVASRPVADRVSRACSNHGPQSC